VARGGEGVRVRVQARPWYWPGDVVVFQSPPGPLVVHRVLGYRLLRGRLSFVLRGDRAPAPDSPCPPERVLGKVVGGQVPRLIATVPLAHRLRALARFSHWVITALFRRLRA